MFKLNWQQGDYFITAYALRRLIRCTVTPIRPKTGPEEWRANVRGFADIQLGTFPTAQEAQDACAKTVAEILAEQQS